MKVYVVNFSPESCEQLIGLYHHLADKADAVIAFNYVNAVVDQRVSAFQGCAFSYVRVRP